VAVTQRILIVEDEPLTALDLRYACEDAGFEAILVTSNRQAFEAIATQGAIIGAVLDLNLGRGESCEAIAQMLGERNIPFVLNTGDKNRSDVDLDSIDAPIIQKPNAAAEVIKRLLEQMR
jgi:DNA-binding response OmpR family regulator